MYVKLTYSLEPSRPLHRKEQNTEQVVGSYNAPIASFPGSSGGESLLRPRKCLGTRLLYTLS